MRRPYKGTDQIRVEIHAKDSGRYKVANCIQAQSVFYGFARWAHGKVISVSVLRPAHLELGGVELQHEFGRGGVSGGERRVELADGAS